MTNLEETIFNWLQNARVSNKKAKNKTHKKIDNIIHYSEKYQTIVRCLKEIKDNNLQKSIKITIKNDKEINGMMLIRFHFLNPEARRRSVSFHLPLYYENIIRGYLD